MLTLSERHTWCSTKNKSRKLFTTSCFAAVDFPFSLTIFPFTISFSVAFDLPLCDVLVAGKRFHIRAAPEKGRQNQRPNILTGINPSPPAFLFLIKNEENNLTRCPAGALPHCLRHQIRSDRLPHAVRLYSRQAMPSHVRAFFSQTFTHAPCSTDLRILPIRD